MCHDPNLYRYKFVISLVSFSSSVPVPFIHFTAFAQWSCCSSIFFFFSSRRRHTRCLSDCSSDVCSSDLLIAGILVGGFWYNQANPVRQARVEAGQGYRHTNGSQIPDAYNRPAGPAIAPMKPTVPAVKTPTAVPASPVALHVYYKDGNPGVATINQVMPQLDLFTTGKRSIHLSEGTLRHWYSLGI